MDARYEITTFEGYTIGSRVADRGIITGLSWEDVVARLRKASIHSLPAEDDLADGRHMHYHDHDGKLCRLTRIFSDKQ